MTDTPRKVADNIMDNACLPEALVKNGVDMCLRFDIKQAIYEAHQDGIREGKRQAAEIARAAEIPPSDNEEPGDDEWWTRCAANGQAIQIARDILSTITDEAEASLCSDCPRVGYPTDETRCDPCPRRRSIPGEAE